MKPSHRAHGTPAPSETSPSRRQFLRHSLAVAGLSALGQRSLAQGGQEAEPADARRPFVGVQLGSHSLFDEGIDRCLDLLRESAGVNAHPAFLPDRFAS